MGEMKRVLLCLAGMLLAGCGVTFNRSCVDQLQEIKVAKEKLALDRHWTNGTPVLAQEFAPFLKAGSIPRCPQGGTYKYGVLGEPPSCSIPEHRIAKN